MNEERINLIPDAIKWVVNDFISKRRHCCLFLFTLNVSDITMYLILKELNNIVYDELDVILTTPWGSWASAYKIAKILRKHCNKLNIYIPYKAKSAGTFITLAANSICLWTLWEIWPLDVQLQEQDENWRIVWKSALEEFKALEQIRNHAIQTFDGSNALLDKATSLKLKDIIHLSNEFTGQTSWKLYDKVDIKKLWYYSRMLEEWRMYGIAILSEFWGIPIDIARKTVQALVHNYPSHWFFIDDIEAKKLALNIIDPEDVNWEMDLLNIMLSDFWNSCIQHNQQQQNQQIIDICKVFSYNWCDGWENTWFNTNNWTNANIQWDSAGDNWNIVL